MSAVDTNKIKTSKKELAINKNAGIDIVSIKRYARSTPDKVRLAGALAKGKKVNLAISILEYSNLLAAKQIILPLKSAIAIAKDKDAVMDNLYVKNIIVNEGPKLKRRRILHQGKATSILKRMSHITVILSDNTNKIIENQKLKIENNKKNIEKKNEN